MLRKLLLAGALAGTTALVGCTHEEQRATLQTETPAGYGFHYVDEGPAAKLAYGQANSDNVGLMLLCEKGSNLVEVSDVVRSNPAPTLTLVSDGRTSDVRVDVQSGPGAGIAVGRAPAASPALSGFRRTGAIEVNYAGLRYGMTAKAIEKAAVERFFTACDRAA